MDRLQLENKQSQSSNQIAVLQVSSNVPPQLICNYCHRSLLRKKCPGIAVSNNLYLDPIPEELILTEIWISI